MQIKHGGRLQIGTFLRSVLSVAQFLKNVYSDTAVACYRKLFVG